MAYTFKIIPATEKCFIDERPEDKIELLSAPMLRNERYEFQVCYYGNELGWHKVDSELEIESDIKDFITVRRIEQVPVALTKWQDSPNEGFLRTAPGLYPDLLIPIEEQHKLIFVDNELRSLFVTVENKEGLPAGDHKITFKAMQGDTCLCSASVTLHVVDALLPEQSLIHTQWFHYDCLSQYYDVPVFSERFWEITETFMHEAHETGLNMILTPTFTPPLDTYVGGERLTVQLVDVTVTDNGYEFGFEKLDRFVNMAKSCGMKYFEIAHLFTQWGCAHAPKIIAKVNGEEKKIFGWESDSHGEDYITFLRAYLTAFIAHAKELGIDQQCYFHISDEPEKQHLESYMKAKESVWDIIGDYHVIDALSNYEFYECGAVKNPIPSTDHIEHFLENNVPELWTYYCTGQQTKVSNRLVAMPGARTRILGIQLFKFDIVGFLQWGFNFYNCQFSNYPINPYIDCCGEYFVPAGDTFAVYPGPNGKPYRTLHASHFVEALTDLRLLQLCSSLVGKERTLAIIEEGLDTPITFSEYPMEQEYQIKLREKICAEIEKAIK